MPIAKGMGSGPSHISVLPVSYARRSQGSITAPPESIAPSKFLVFADAWPGKFSHLDEALAALRPGGVYVIDDLLPQPNWPDRHQADVDRLLADLARRDGFVFAQMGWATGVAMLVRQAA